MKNNILKMKHAIGILSYSSVVGKQEQSGPLQNRFDFVDLTDRFGQDTWEKAESEMQHIALNLALSKANLPPQSIEALFAGDLLNQCIGSSYGLVSFTIPFLGLYGACSTAAEGILLSALLTDSGRFSSSGAVSSSHYCSSERQFRFPLEYGGQRAPTSQWTVTGAGAFLIGKSEHAVQIKEAVIGQITDYGITDINNMGAAMAPAAASTLLRYFSESEYSPSDFDAIYTGDLGYEGRKLLLDLLKEEGLHLETKLFDCGLEIYNRKKQDKHSGGSGCGCSAVVLAAKLIPALLSKEYKKILFLGTGAMMSPASVQQGASIPSIAHLLHLASPDVSEKGSV